jgi:hypothetical protein
MEALYELGITLMQPPLLSSDDDTRTFELGLENSQLAIF